jgi:putative DNA primase/helicase
MPDLATAEGQAAIEVHLDGIDLLILDNLSALCRYGKENEGESWLPVQGWALSLRRRGMAVVFVHHAGKSGTQRGTSRREDLLDTIITLKRSSDYSPEQGLRCEVHFEKTRAIIGDAAKPVEVQLETGSGGQAVWTTRDLEDIKQRRAFELYDAGATVREVAEELGIGKSSAHRLRTKWDKSRDKGHAVPLSHSIAPGQRDRRANGGERVASQ